MTNSLAAAAKNTSTSGGTDGDCKFCGKTGLLILPLRYACAAVEANAPALPSQCGGKGITDVVLKKSTYALRMVRDGFVYLFTNRQSFAFDCQSYAASGDGYLAKFPPYLPPPAMPDFTCSPNQCGRNASMISIERPLEVIGAYLLFSPTWLTVSRLTELCNVNFMESLVKKGVVTKLSPAQLAKGANGLPHSLVPSQLVASVVEFNLASQKNGLAGNALAKSAFNSAFPPLIKHPKENSGNRATGYTNLTRLDSLHQHMVDMGAVAVVAPDPIGLVQELNDHRNDPFNLVENLNITFDAASGGTNSERFNVLQSLKEVQTNFEQGAVRSRSKWSNDLKNEARAKWEPIFPDDSPELMQVKRYAHMQMDATTKTPIADRQEWTSQNPQKAARVQDELAEIDRECPASWTLESAHKEWQSKYEPLLDRDAMTRFENAYTKATDDAMTLANERVQDFVSWLVHPSVVDAFNNLFDRVDIGSGASFQYEVNMCLLGMVGIPETAKILDAWLYAPTIEESNLFMRGFLLNQESLIANANEAFSAATAAAAGAKYPAHANGDKLYKAFKSFASAMKSSDSAWDEYIRNIGKAGVPDMMNTWEGRKLYDLSVMTRALTRAGISQVEVAAVARLGGILHAMTGKLAELIRFDELMYRVDPQAPFDPKDKKSNVATRNLEASKANNATGMSAAGARAKAEVEALQGRERARQLILDADEKYRANMKKSIASAIEAVKKDSPGATNNYHQVRVGVILAGIEAAMLYFKWKEQKDSGAPLSREDNLKLYASFMTVVSGGLDTTYSFLKSVREKESNTALLGAGDILRGGFKMAAGTLALGAGVIGVGLEWQTLWGEFKGERRPGTLLLSSMKLLSALGSSFWGALAAFSYSGPLLQRIALYTTDVPGAGRVIIWFAEAAGRLAQRVALLRLVARLNWIGFIISSVGEIGYATYLHFQPTKFELWCKSSQFGKRVGGIPAFNTVKDELTALAAAVKNTPGLNGG